MDDYIYGGLYICRVDGLCVCDGLDGWICFTCMWMVVVGCACVCLQWDA